MKGKVLWPLLAAVLAGAAWLGARATFFPQIETNDEVVQVGPGEAYTTCYKPTFGKRQIVVDMETRGLPLETGVVEQDDAQSLIAKGFEGLEFAALGESYSPNIIDGTFQAYTSGDGPEWCTLFVNHNMDPVQLRYTLKTLFRL